MKKMGVIPAIMLMSLVLFSTAAYGAVLDSEVFTVGTESTFPPFVFRNAEGELTGFDIDLVNAIAHKLDKKAEFVDIAFDALLPAMADQKIDMIAGGFSITAERMERVAFSTPYYYSDDAVVMGVGAGGPGSIEGLRGKTVTVQARTTQDDFLTALGGIVVKRYQRSDEALKAVISGIAEAAFMDGSVAERFLSDNPALGAGLNIVLRENLSCDGMALAVRKMDSEFLDAVNLALEDLDSEGYLKGLEKKWFSR